MNDRDLFYGVALNSLPSMECHCFMDLLPQMTEKRLQEEFGVSDFSWVEEELKLIQKENIQIITYGDPKYPFLLKQISDPPPLLYVKGVLPQTQFFLAVVGARRASPYGLEVTEFLCRELIQHDITIVSGLAQGIDRKAHETALKHQGQTVAVLGNGLLVNYPLSHQKLQEKISSCGALISEFPLTMPPLKHHFPRRNRIISGLSQGVLVVEASLRSGSLITARCALEQGRDVFAVPGNIIAEASRGTHRLIQQGAKLVVQPQDILEELDVNTGPSFVKTKEGLTSVSQVRHSLTKEEERILKLTSQAQEFESLLNQSNYEQSQLSQTLLSLELKGLIKRWGESYQRSL